MIENDNRMGSLADRSPSVLRGQDSFDDNGTAPNVTNPAQVLPSDGGAGKSRANVDERHCTLAGNDDVGKIGDATVKEKAA